MQITVPIYITEDRNGGTRRVVARPLFARAPIAVGEVVDRVVHQLTNRLRTTLGELARGNDHRELSHYHSQDVIDFKKVKLDLNLHDSTATLRLILVKTSPSKVGGNLRHVVFSPSLPDVWFDVLAGESLTDRAVEVYSDWVRTARRDGLLDKNDPKAVGRLGLTGKAWIDSIVIDVNTLAPKPTPVDPLRALLGGEDVSDGAAELRKIGRCLNHLPPNDLAKPFGIAGDLKRLETLLTVGDRRGIILVGEPGSGKSARIEGVAANRPKTGSRRLMWQFSPARLISGMSYLGQWQERVLAILKHAHRYDHTLVIDDFLSLFEAGKTRDSSMCVADMLRNQLDSLPVRIVAELTPQAWAIFRNRDPKFASQFVVMPTEAMDRKTAMPIVVRAAQSVEAQHRCIFELGVLKEIVALTDRFDQSAVLPGKAVDTVKVLANKMSRQCIGRCAALKEFSLRSGLLERVVDRSASVSREALMNQVREQVVGQDEAVTALVDRAMVAINRMNDVTRPIGTYLLVGPTGVGKTELAKAIANCLFDAGGLIRIDMNELSSPGSASRLIGTFDAPEGVLTSAIRRRPHAVLLLDEIEKAHPSVLDVLLPALGEARLSDARGRTVDLSGLLILMTSNLGSRQSISSTGFVSGQDESVIRQKHSKAVRQFFRPEFFNRIDDVLYFDRLPPESIEEIAWLQVRRLLLRDGLQRRNVLIDIAPEAIASAARSGVDSAMGARALKRQIERDLIRPAAETLAANPSDAPTLLQIEVASQDAVNLGDTSTPRITVRCRPITYATGTPSPDTSTRHWFIACCDFLDDVQSRIGHQPVRFDTSDSNSAVNLETIERISIRETYDRCREIAFALQDMVDHATTMPPATPVQSASGPHPDKQRRGGASRIQHRDYQAHCDIQDYWDEVLVADDPSTLTRTRTQLAVEIGRLESQLKHRGKPTRWVLHFHWFGDLNLFVAASDYERWVRVNEAHQDRFAERPEDPLIGQKAMTWYVAHQASDWLKNSEGLDVRFQLDEFGMLPTRHQMLEVEGALAAASLAQVCGGWQVVDHAGKVSIGNVWAEPAPEPSDQDFSASQNRFSDSSRDAMNSLSPIRRIIDVHQGGLDLEGARRSTGDLNEASFAALMTESYYWIPPAATEPDVTSNKSPNAGANQ